MAKIINEKSKLKLEYDFGLNEKGKQILRSKTYSNLNKDLEADKILKTADMISEFSEKDLLKTKVITEKEITEEV